ncbi:ATP-binding protein [Streptomyces sp. NBC_01477]|uniref:ATP-binding protein n=1 Tax=Streptomyces sp. NBC_01477 TaxID=2976015 RepID=UPI002E333518|nr:ATP-binding protein [Streptomyces sp. NBC_01477]
MLPVPNAPAGPCVIAHRWAYDPENVQRARDELRLHLAKWGTPVEVMESAVLVLSELFTNALRHARQPEGRHVETRFERRASGVRIEVHDAGETRPERREVHPDEECGRGLVLVDALTGGRWGVGERAGVGKMVWAVCGPAHAGVEVSA